MKLFGLIGSKLQHSFSKLYFDKKFKELKEELKFELFPLENIELFRDLLKSKPELKGLAVTIPYKIEVIKYLDELDISAKETGAVNCIKIAEKTTGFNTDILGFEKSFLSLPVHKKSCLVLGDGGASRAVKYILSRHSIKFLQVSRKPSLDAIFYNQITEKIISEYSVIINCTSLGMFPNVQFKPDIPYQYLSPKNILFDLVYNPEKTSFLIEGEKKGAIIKNGLEMLHIQAEENWRIWNED
ncbi:MAG: shikimate dehydrogenase [Ferruginibacter sp.]